MQSLEPDLAREAFKIGDVLLLGVRTIDDEGVKERIKHLGLMPLWKEIFRLFQAEAGC